MRIIRFKNKVILIIVVLLFGLILCFLENDSFSDFFDTISTILSSKYGRRKHPTAWPPRIRIVKKHFAESNGSTRSQEGRSGLGRTPMHQECRFPSLSVDDPEIMHLFHKVAPLKCAKAKNWVYTRNGTFYIDQEASDRHGGPDAITCDYTNFWRVTDFETESSTKSSFPNGSKLHGDFFKVDCRSSKGRAKYSNIHAAIRPSPEVIQRCRSKQLPKTALGLNVYMLGFDSISRMTFMRKLPKTYEYLVNTMKAIVLKGYNIVGDGTPQALIPIFTGKTEVELPLTRKRFRNAQYVNVYPFVWNEFRDAGYATLFGEDAAHSGAFTYRLKGFDEQPTDHYMRTFYVFDENVQGRSWRPKYCFGSQPHHKVHFKYVEDFWESYPIDIRKFAFQFHGDMSHDDINQVEIADADMVKHLRYFMENGHMNDTILIFMSDHGHRFASLRETQQGKLEERLPFFAFAFPPWFAKKYHAVAKAFQSNSARLTTPFDIHATLQSILNFHAKPELADLKERQLSLFDIIPIERDCSDAGIEPHWCSCLEWTNVTTEDLFVQYAAASLVHAMNLETERERNSCAILKLDSIEKASVHSPSSALLQYKSARDKDGFVPDLTDDTPVDVVHYQINLRTTPGNAHYEASVIFDQRSSELVIDLDTVSHVNKYGDLPHCVIDRDYFLAKWCVCWDKVTETEKVHDFRKCAMCCIATGMVL